MRGVRIEKVKKIPGYVPSRYQGMMTEAMEEYISIMGQMPFSKLRILKDDRLILNYQKAITETDAYKTMGTEEYIASKKEIFAKIRLLEGISEEEKKRIEDFFEQYKDVYFEIQLPEDFVEKLDKSFEQMYNFSSIRYSFNLFSYDFENEEMQTEENNMAIYEEILLAILSEAYAPLKEAESKIKEIRKKQESISIDDLTKQALQTAPRISEIQRIPKIQEHEREIE